MGHYITKRLVLGSRGCEHKTYNNYYNGHLLPEPGEEKKALFAQGKEIGKLAWRLYPGGIDASMDDNIYGNNAITYTKNLIDNGEGIIYEAAFQTRDGLHFFKSDILLTDKGHLKEVKMSTSIKDEHILELAYMHWVLLRSDCKLQIKKYFLVYLNKEYVRKGEIDVHELFIEADVTHRVLKALMLIEIYIKRTEEILRARKAPAEKVGEHCYSPWECEYKDQCFEKFMGQDSILNAVGMQNKQRFFLLDRGIMNLTELPRVLKMNAKQMIQVQAHTNNEIIADRDWLLEYLNDFKHEPVLRFLDFETSMEGIPPFDGLSPYSQLPFQWSMHVLNAGGTIEHFEFLGSPYEDPREQFVVELLKHVGESGPIITYNQVFELSRLRELSEALPKYSKQIKNVMLRIRDLMTPFKELKLYAPAMRGSYSLKKVLPAFLDDLTYTTLVIANGAVASASFAKMKKLKEKEKEKLRRQLLEYCAMDTKALLRLFQFTCDIVAEETILLKKNIKPNKSKTKKAKKHENI